MKAKGNPSARTSRPADGEPTGSPSVTSQRRPRRRTPPAQKLIETPGPEPSTPLEEVRLTVGTIVGTHGVRGELKMLLQTDDPEHLATLRHVFLGDAERPVALERVRFHKGMALLTLEGVTTPEAGAELTGTPVRIAGSDARPLEEGEYFLFQLIGLRAVTEDGAPLGTVTDLIETGAHDVLVIGDRPGAAGDLLVPNHPEFVPEISPERGVIVVRPPVYED